MKGKGRPEKEGLPSSDAALRRWEMRTTDGRTDARSGEKLVIRLLRVIDGSLDGWEGIPCPAALILLTFHDILIISKLALSL